MAPCDCPLTYHDLDLAWNLADAVTEAHEKGFRDQIAAILFRDGTLDMGAAYAAKEAVLRHYEEHGQPLVTRDEMQALVDALPELEPYWLWWGKGWELSMKAVYKCLREIASPIEAVIISLHPGPVRDYVFQHRADEFDNGIEPEQFAKIALEIL